MAKIFWRSLSERDRRALAALAAAAAIFLFLDLLVLPLMDRAQKLHSVLPLKEKTLRKYQQKAALSPGQEKDWQGLQARLAVLQKGLLSSRTAPLAAAELQEVVKQLLARQGIEMQNAAFQPVRLLKVADATYSVVPLSLSFECRLDQLTNFLLAAHSSGKALALDQFSIRALPPNLRGQQKMVSVQMVIRGLMLAEAAPAPAS